MKTAQGIGRAEGKNTGIASWQGRMGSAQLCPSDDAISFQIGGVCAARSPLAMLQDDP